MYSNWDFRNFWDFSIQNHCSGGFAAHVSMQLPRSVKQLVRCSQDCFTVAQPGGEAIAPPHWPVNQNAE